MTTTDLHRIVQHLRTCLAQGRSPILTPDEFRIVIHLIEAAIENTPDAGGQG